MEQASGLIWESQVNHVMKERDVAGSGKRSFVAGKARDIRVE